MTDEQNPVADVPAELPTVLEEPTPVGTPLSDGPVHVRVGGRAGVQVQQGGAQVVKRVTGNPETDTRQVPVPVLAAVRELLEVHGGDSPPLTASERLLAVRDLLTPWL